MKKLFAIIMLLASTTSFAGFIPELRSMRVRFSGDQNVTLIRYSSYCTLDDELYKFYGGERDVITMPAETRAEMIPASLENHGICQFPNGMYLVNGVGYRFFQRQYACKTLPGEVEHQEKLAPGSYRPVSSRALRDRIVTGDCSYNEVTTFCNKMAANRIQNGVQLCVQSGETVDISMTNPQTGQTLVERMKVSDIKTFEARAKSIEDINDEIYRLEIERGGCDMMSNKNGCVSFLALMSLPDKYAKAFGALGAGACYWISGVCVRIIDVKLDDAKYEKQKLREEQQEREKEAKARGTITSPSPATSASASLPPGTVVGPSANYPDQFPPTYNGEVTISEAPPGPMPGSDGSSHSGHM